MILEHFFRINAFFTKFLKFGHNFRTVLRIGNAEPLRSGVEHFAGCGAVIDEFVYHERNEKLALEVFNVFRVGKECLEEFFTVGKIIGREPPEVHGNGGSVRNGYPLAIIVEVFYNTVEALYFCTFNNRGKMLVLISFADTAAYSAALRQSIAYSETYHGVFACGAFGQVVEPLAHDVESIAVVEIVAVQYGKRLFNDILSHHDSVVRAPRLGAVSRAGETFRQCVKALEYQFTGNVTFVF